MVNPAPMTDPQLAEATANTMQVLVIDDSETDRQRILRLCTDAGLNFEPTEVGTIKEMRQALKSKKFDLVFIDYLLAGEDGLDAIDLLNQHPEQKAASIMIAGEGQIGIAVEAMRRGCSDYLTKPEMTVQTLQKSVATALERRMLTYLLQEERELRHSLERNIRKYANSCSAEMRSILSATLRRVRKLRTQILSEDNVIELGALEASIDRLWDALPAFSEATDTAILDNKKTLTRSDVMQLRPN